LRFARSGRGSRFHRLTERSSRLGFNKERGAALVLNRYRVPKRARLRTSLNDSARPHCLDQVRAIPISADQRERTATERVDILSVTDTLDSFTDWHYASVAHDSQLPQLIELIRHPLHDRTHLL
jgi:hypothetical protein